MIIRHTFEEQLHDLQNDLLRLGRFVEEALGKALDALVRQDAELANRIIDEDDFADDLDFEIQTRAMQLLALQQPMARDLRVIGASLRIVLDLERIGDYAVDVAKVARGLSGQHYTAPVKDIIDLGAAARQMVGDALQTFVSRDIEQARQVAGADDDVDVKYDEVQARLIKLMREDNASITQATRLLLVARSLERAADHATNIAEYIYYVETGEMRQLAREEHQENKHQNDATLEALVLSPRDHDASEQKAAGE